MDCSPEVFSNTLRLRVQSGQILQRDRVANEGSPAKHPDEPQRTPTTTAARTRDSRPRPVARLTTGRCEPTPALAWRQPAHASNQRPPSPGGNRDGAENFGAPSRLSSGPRVSFQRLHMVTENVPQARRAFHSPGLDAGAAARGPAYLLHPSRVRSSCEDTTLGRGRACRSYRARRTLPPARVGATAPPRLLSWPPSGLRLLGRVRGSPAQSAGTLPGCNADPAQHHRSRARAHPLARVARVGAAVLPGGTHIAPHSPVALPRRRSLPQPSHLD